MVAINKDKLGRLGSKALAAGLKVAASAKEKTPEAKAAVQRGVKKTSNRWHAVKVNKPRAEVVRGGPPEPLAALGDAVGYRVETTPDGGTEIAAHVREGAELPIDAEDPDKVIEEALHDSKSIIEEQPRR